MHSARDRVGPPLRFYSQILMSDFLLLVLIMYILNTSIRALKPSQDKKTGYCAHENEREYDVR